MIPTPTIIFIGVFSGICITAFGFTIAYYYVKWRNSIFEMWGKGGEQ